MIFCNDDGNGNDSEDDENNDMGMMGMMMRGIHT